MTTATLPDEILTDVPSDELEAWLNHEIEKPCGLFIKEKNGICNNPASWLLFIRTSCSCLFRNPEFICDECYERVHTSKLTCHRDESPITVRFIERAK